MGLATTTLGLVIGHRVTEAGTTLINLFCPHTEEEAPKAFQEGEAENALEEGEAANADKVLAEVIVTA